MKKLTPIMLFTFLSFALYPQPLKLTNPRQNGPEVEALQKQLLYLGHSLGSDGVDSWFGPSTEKALKDYQKEHELPITGEIPRSKKILQNLFWRIFLA